MYYSVQLVTLLLTVVRSRQAPLLRGNKQRLLLGNRFVPSGMAVVESLTAL